VTSRPFGLKFQPTGVWSQLGPTLQTIARQIAAGVI
jgi:hypothetical protein